MNENKRIGVGIIGLGGVGQKLLQTFLQHPSSEVWAVCDNNETLLSHTVSSINHVTGSTSYEDVIQNDNVDLVYIAVPPKYHFPIVMKAMESKKHILCEKPLANSVDEAEAMCRAATQANIVHAMNFPTFFRPSYREFSRRIQEGAIGNLRRIEITTHFPVWPRAWQQNAWIGSREQGGFVREVIPHFIQLILAQFGALHNVTSYVEYPEDPHACETGIIALMELENHIPVVVNGMSSAAPVEHVSLTAIGTQGTLSLANWNQLLFAARGESQQPIILEEKDHLHELVDFVLQSIIGRNATVIDFSTGLQVQRILEKLYNI
ncbi:Gfo/Idh/MocA family oxidoreductase [Paenibacillus alginolyticus]|uniref:Gfo/Idh/MocA family protein n=1 Tax=Paenibacillus alginolyticus TaxID=59839 RepID=UPI00042915D8|nr:Gfo/Idh/MocA family oxidoreductase [Paenibacillus alginolyticus]MCY9666489.1 Gfo/Idh/MocA family oxidoreductase [Paenibacillus alginolyticus]